MSEITIELIQWNCPECRQFGGGLSIAPAQAHADATSHTVKAEITTTVREKIAVTPGQVTRADA